MRRENNIDIRSNLDAVLEIVMQKGDVPNEFFPTRIVVATTSEGRHRLILTVDRYLEEGEFEICS